MLGSLVGLIGDLSSTATRRKYQILKAFERILFNCQVTCVLIFTKLNNHNFQRAAFPMWSLSVPPFHFNSKTGYLELSLVESSTLVLFSTCLWKTLSPHQGVEPINSKKVVFPQEKSFSYFSIDPLLISSTAYTEVKSLFESGKMSGFFSPIQDVKDTMRCMSDISNLETYLKSDDDSPLYMCLINFESTKPFEIGSFSMLSSGFHFNYLDLNDKANIYLSRYIYQEMSRFIQNSVYVQTYFGLLQCKNLEQLSNEMSIIFPLIMGSSHAILPKIQFFLKILDIDYQYYFLPNKSVPEKDGWISVQEFDKLYVDRILDNKTVQIFPNVKPYPSIESYFLQPFYLLAENFGKYNFINGESGNFAGETRGAKCLLGLFNYSAGDGSML